MLSLIYPEPDMSDFQDFLVYAPGMEIKSVVHSSSKDVYSSSKDVTI